MPDFFFYKGSSELPFCSVVTFNPILNPIKTLHPETIIFKKKNSVAPCELCEDSNVMLWSKILFWQTPVWKSTFILPKYIYKYIYTSKVHLYVLLHFQRYAKKSAKESGIIFLKYDWSVLTIMMQHLEVYLISDLPCIEDQL